MDFRHIMAEPVEHVETATPDSGEPWDGVRIRVKNGWLAVLPCGTEAMCKIYAESYDSSDHRDRLVEAAERFIDLILQEKLL
jgi:phosphoglucomutase